MVSGRLEPCKIVPAFTEVWRRQPRHSKVQGFVRNAQASSWAQTGQRKPSGQRSSASQAAPSASSGKRRWKSIRDEGGSHRGGSHGVCSLLVPSPRHDGVIKILGNRCQRDKPLGNYFAVDSCRPSRPSWARSRSIVPKARTALSPAPRSPIPSRATPSSRDGGTGGSSATAAPSSTTSSSHASFKSTAAASASPRFRCAAPPGQGTPPAASSRPPPISAWDGANKTSVNANTDDPPDVLFGVQATVLPLTIWSGNEMLRLKLDLWTQKVTAVHPKAGGIWRIDTGGSTRSPDGLSRSPGQRPILQAETAPKTDRFCRPKWPLK